MVRSKERCNVISTTVSKEFWEKAMTKGLSWAECLRIGIAVKLGEMGDGDLNNYGNYARRIHKMAEIIEDFARKVEVLEYQIKETEEKRRNDRKMGL